VSPKKPVKIVFVITLSNFHQLWYFLAQRWPRWQNFARCSRLLYYTVVICIRLLTFASSIWQRMPRGLIILRY